MSPNGVNVLLYVSKLGGELILETFANAVKKRCSILGMYNKFTLRAQAKKPAMRAFLELDVQIVDKCHWAVVIVFSADEEFAVFDPRRADLAIDRNNNFS